MLDSLLYDNNGIGENLPGQVFSDLRFEKFLPQSTISLLARLPAANIIKKRQALFRLLENEDYLGKFKELRRRLDELRDAKKRLDLADGKLSRCYALIFLAEKYLLCIEYFEELRGCELTDALADNWSTILPERKNALGSWISDTKARLLKSSEFLLTLHDGIRLSESDGSASYIESLRGCLCTLGLGHGEKSDLSLKMPAELDSSVIALFSETLGDSTDIYFDFLENDLDALLLLIGEIDFYLNTNDLIDSARSKNIPVCYPELSDNKIFDAKDICDISLLNECEIVPNDAYFSDDSPFYFVKGANGGGKTTFLRAVGINLLLFLSGAPIFASKAKIFPFTKVFTHFPADELTISTGRFADECARADEMIAQADSRSFLLLNETYCGTNDELGCKLALKAAEQICEKSAFGLFVTHFSRVEYSRFGILKAVVTENSSQRTYKIVNSGVGRGSYALDILKKYRLDADSLIIRAKNLKGAAK